MAKKAQFLEDLGFKSSIKSFLPSYRRRSSKGKQNRGFRKPCEGFAIQGEKPCERNSQALRIHFAGLAKPVRSPAKQFAGLANSFRKACEVDFWADFGIPQALRSLAGLASITWNHSEDLFLLFLLISFPFSPFI